MAQGVKDTALPQLWNRWQLQCGFHPRAGNFHVLWAWPKKKAKKNENLAHNYVSEKLNHKIGKDICSHLFNKGLVSTKYNELINK